MRAYLERIDPDRGMARFYAVTVMPTLFGDWAVVREWGRIGQGGTLRESVYRSQPEAHQAADAIIRKKELRSYRSRIDDNDRTLASGQA